MRKPGIIYFFSRLRICRNGGDVKGEVERGIYDTRKKFRSRRFEKPARDAEKKKRNKGIDNKNVVKKKIECKWQRKDVAPGAAIKYHSFCLEFMS